MYKPFESWARARIFCLPLNASVTRPEKLLQIASRKVDRYFFRYFFFVNKESSRMLYLVWSGDFCSDPLECTSVKTQNQKAWWNGTLRCTGVQNQQPCSPVVANPWTGQRKTLWGRWSTERPGICWCQLCLYHTAAPGAATASHCGHLTVLARSGGTRGHVWLCCGERNAPEESRQHCGTGGGWLFVALSKAKYNFIKNNSNTSPLDAKWQNSRRCRSFWYSTECMA